MTGPSPRIPLALQAVFIASNQGHEVIKPPPEKLASKVFSVARTLSGFSSASAKKQQTRTPKKKNGADKGTVKKTKKKLSNKQMGTVVLSPQAYMEALFRSQKKVTARTDRQGVVEYHESLRTAYFNPPTPLQTASFDTNLIRLVKADRQKEFEATLRTGISLAPCNLHGESLVHHICRLKKPHFLRCLLKLDAEQQSSTGSSSVVQLVDNRGRTPLHSICSTYGTPCFETIELLLEADPSFLRLKDDRGCLPLSYIAQEHWGGWLEFLLAKKELLLIKNQSSIDLTQRPAGSRPMRDPPNALPLSFAALVASGKLQPADVDNFREMFVLKNTDYDDAEEDDDDEVSSSHYSESYNDDDFFLQHQAWPPVVAQPVTPKGRRGSTKMMPLRSPTRRALTSVAEMQQRVQL